MYNDLIALHPSSFETIQWFFTKFTSLVFQCKQCGIERKDDQLVLSILIKPGLEYSVFVSTFHFRRASIPNWKIPSLDSFAESLIHDQDKLVQMGVLQTSKNQSLSMSNLKNSQARGKDPKKTDLKPKENQRSFDGALGSIKEKTKCPYCMRGFHPEIQRMKKNLDQLTTLLEHNNISLPQGVEMSDAREQTE